MTRIDWLKLVAYASSPFVYFFATRYAGISLFHGYASFPEFVTMSYGIACGYLAAKFL